MENIFCEFCKHEFNSDEVTLSILTKGIIVLAGRNKTALGLSCINPDCQQTLFMITPNNNFLQQCEEFLRDNPSLTYPAIRKDGASFADSFVYPKYKYSVPWFYFDDNSEIYESFEIFPVRFGNSDEERDNLASQLDHYIHRDPHFENTMCSYVPDWYWIPASRPRSRALLFREDQLMDLLKLENESGEKIFPRYLHMNKQQLALEKLSASQSYSYLKAGEKWDQDQEDVTDQKDLEDQEHKIQHPEGIIIGKISYVGPTEDGDERFINILRNAGNSTFLEILTTDPGLLDISLASPINDLIHKFSKVKYPYLDKTKPFDLLNIDHQLINQSEKEHLERVQKIQENVTSSTVQDWLSQNIDNFIANYERISSETDFNYAALWELIKKNIFWLFNHLDEETRKKRFAFYMEGAKYIFVFDGGDRVIVDEQEGFNCLNYLVRNKFSFVRVTDFEILNRRFIVGENKEAYDLKDANTYPDDFGISQDILDDTAIKEYRKKIQELKIKLQDYNLRREEKYITRDQLKKLEKEYKKVTYKGKSKTFSSNLDNIIKKHKANIKYSLAHLADKKGGKEIAEHFVFSLIGLGTPHVSYSPNPDIDWYL